MGVTSICSEAWFDAPGVAGATPDTPEEGPEATAVTAATGALPPPGRNVLLEPFPLPPWKQQCGRL